MSRDSDLIIVGADGRAYTAAVGSTAPTDALTVPGAFAAGDLGWCHEDGLVLEVNEDRQEFKAWGNLGSIRTQVTSRTRTFQIQPLQSSPLVMAIYDSVAEPTPDGDGAWDYPISDEPGQDLRAWIFDVIDGKGADAKIIRYYIANGDVTARGSLNHHQTSMLGYQLTVTAYPGDDGYSIHKFVVQPSLAA